MKKILSVFFALIIFSCAGTDSPEPLSPVDTFGFIRTEGTRVLLPDGSPFQIRGVAFGNSVWSNPSDADEFTHHRMDDYKNIKKMGFNAVRFYLNYGLFEHDFPGYTYKNGGFAWLARNITAAKEAGIYLILNMHYPQGGFQSTGNGDALWEKEKNQKRLAALWKQIAIFCRAEEQVIGYGLVNEPVPVDGMQQWTNLAQELVNSIREVDENHLIFVERAIWLKSGEIQEDKANLRFPQGVSDAAKKLVYEFHMYEPFEFTHQNASWTSQKGKHATYPDKTRLQIKNSTWAGMSKPNPAVPAGSFDWTFFEGRPFKAENTEYLIACPAVQTRYLGGSGKVFAADISVDEYDENGEFIRTAWKSPDGAAGWNFWAQNGKGRMTAADKGDGKTCIAVEGTSSDSNATFHNSGIRVVTGHFYRISGYLKGQNTHDKADITLRIDFYKGGGISVWNKGYLSEYLDDYVKYGKEHNAPMYLGEFGLNRDCFTENRGGLAWVEDMLDLLNEKGINYNYHTYHESAFGIYYNNDGFPDPARANDKLIELFTRKQGAAE